MNSVDTLCWFTKHLFMLNSGVLLGDQSTGRWWVLFHRDGVIEFSHHFVELISIDRSSRLLLLQLWLGNKASCHQQSCEFCIQVCCLLLEGNVAESIVLLCRVWSRASVLLSLKWRFLFFWLYRGDWVGWNSWLFDDCVSDRWFHENSRFPAVNRLRNFFDWRERFSWTLLDNMSWDRWVLRRNDVLFLNMFSRWFGPLASSWGGLLTWWLCRTWGSQWQRWNFISATQLESMAWTSYQYCETLSSWWRFFNTVGIHPWVVHKHLEVVILLGCQWVEIVGAQSVYEILRLKNFQNFIPLSTIMAEQN